MRNMGIDLIGEKPKSKSGAYFRSNWWWWRIMWSFTCKVGKSVLSDDDAAYGGTNDCWLITAEKAEKIGQRLKDACEMKWQHQEAIDELKQAYNKKSPLNEEGEVRYRFNWTFTKKFANFCIKSGGFRIC